LQRVISIRTPENIELKFALAGAGSRAAAYFVDLLLMFFVGQLLVNLIAYLVGLFMRTFQAGSQVWAAAVGSLLAFLLYNGYFMVFEWLMNGQTPGKRLMHIRVIKEGGYALRFVDTLLRNLLRVIDFIPLFYGVGLVSLLLSRYSQRLGDLVAGTLVVHQEPIETESLLADLEATAGSLSDPLPQAQVAAIPAEVVTLATDFLRRRADLSARHRQEIGMEVIDLIRRTSGLAPSPRQSMESFMTAIIRQAEQIAPSSFPAQLPL